MGSFYELLHPGRPQPSLCPECTAVWDPAPPSRSTHLSPALLSMGQKRWRCCWSIPGNAGSMGQSQTRGHLCKGSVRGQSGLKFIKTFPPLQLFFWS